MGERIAFATTNWKDRLNKPSGTTQAAWDAAASSGFNGFPFHIPEYDPADVLTWDGNYEIVINDDSYLYRVSAAELVFPQVQQANQDGKIVTFKPLGIGFTLEEAIKYVWRIKQFSANITTANYGGTTTNNSAIGVMERDILMTSINPLGRKWSGAGTSYNPSNGFVSEYSYDFTPLLFKVGEYYYPYTSGVYIESWTLQEFQRTLGIFMPERMLIGAFFEISDQYGGTSYYLDTVYNGFPAFDVVGELTILGKTFSFIVGLDWLSAIYQMPGNDRVAIVQDVISRFPGYSNISAEFTPIKYWQYANSQGQPVYDEDSGEQLVDPLS